MLIVDLHFNKKRLFINDMKMSLFKQSSCFVPKKINDFLTIA